MNDHTVSILRPPIIHITRWSQGAQFIWAKWREPCSISFQLEMNSIKIAFWVLNVQLHILNIHLCDVDVGLCSWLSTVEILWKIVDRAPLRHQPTFTGCSRDCLSCMYASHWKDTGDIFLRWVKLHSGPEQVKHTVTWYLSRGKIIVVSFVSAVPC